MADLKIFTNNIEHAASEIIDSIAKHPYFKNQKIRIMPDVHAGKGIVVGFTCPMGEYVNPEHIGADIGCGVEIELFDQLLPEEAFPLFEQRIRNAIPMGKNLNKNREFDLKDFCKFVRKELSRAAQSSGGLVNEIPFSKESDITLWCKGLNIDEKTFYKSIGTLGGGNHFIELDCDDAQTMIGVTVHTGSRNLGQKVCRKWAKKAIATGGYLSGALLCEYLTDMVICQAYAQYNRKIILEKIADIYKKMCKGKVVDRVSSVHNYVDFEDMIIRKGAIRAYKGERMVIPFNMADGVAIYEGLSNEDWNFSAPHGTGRRMSRKKAREQLSMDQYHSNMSLVYSTSVCPGTLDEAPAAYKDTEEVMYFMHPTCKMIHYLTPLINIKDTSDTDRD